MRTGVVPADVPRRRPTRPSTPRRRRSRPASTGSSATTTSGPWASPSARRWRPSPSSARWPPSSARRGGDGPFLGTLVARVGLVPDAVLVARVRRARRAWRPGRVIAGLGHRRPAERGGEPGLRHPLRAGRRAPGRAGRAAPAQLVGAGLPVWVAGGPAGAPRRPRAAGAAAQPVGRRAGAGGRAAAGPDGVRGDLGRARRRRRRRRSPRRLAGAGTRPGATWAVFGWPVDVEALVGRRARRRRRPIVGRAGNRAVDFSRWSSAGSTGCRPTSSPPSTT